MVYVACTALLFIGCLGLLVTLLLGGHFGHRGAVQSVHHGSAAPHPHHGGASQHAHHEGASQHAHHANSASDQAGGKALTTLLSVFSPIMFFSICIGAGATGLMLKHFHLPTASVVAASVVGGVAFFALIIRPTMSVILKFASTPSRALEGSVAEAAEVISRFDSSGRGLVNLRVDGQIVRVLATLEEADLPMASEIHPGDRLLVTTVDGHTNACRVARI